MSQEGTETNVGKTARMSVPPVAMTADTNDVAVQIVVFKPLGRFADQPFHRLLIQGRGIG